MKYFLRAIEITSILQSAESCVRDEGREVLHLLTDSRHATMPAESLFFAIPTQRSTGCRYVVELYGRGVRNFVVPKDAGDDYRSQFEHCTEANFWYVDDVVAALQSLAAWRRGKFNIPVIGITGSNGKTIVKDWAVQMLSDGKKVVSNPRSYNSQIGVPLSVWQMDGGDEIGVFEAGISQKGEMGRLRRVMRPTIGLLTNIGQAHDENFSSHKEKLAEKLKLFEECEVVIYCSDQTEVADVMEDRSVLSEVRRYSWGRGMDADLRVTEMMQEGGGTGVKIEAGGCEGRIFIPFVDRASVENAMQCVALMSWLGYGMDEVAQKCLRLTAVAMRMELNEAIGGSLLVNDSYSLDLDSLEIALDYVQHEPQHSVKTLIISDIMQSGLPEEKLYGQVAAQVIAHGVDRMIGIGPALCRWRDKFENVNAVFYPTTEAFLRSYPFHTMADETILLKGARKFHFEDIAKVLQRKSHQTIMEVNLSNLVSNLNYYRSLLHSGTKLMAMVKASSYGAGTVQVASALQYHHVDYLTVAYGDEGVDLRMGGVTLPIMVMNPEEESYSDIIRHGLEPVVYSFRSLEAFATAVREHCDVGERYPVHVELDTGMHRLGFRGEDVGRLVDILSAEDCNVRVKSIFSHLACSEDDAMDDFTHGQINRFEEWSEQLRESLGDKGIMRHILNSSGIVRFPEAQMDMVRLGIGLYGIAPQPEVQKHLLPVSRLKTRISQIKEIPAGEPVGYNCRWTAPRNTRLAIASIGYADGLNRLLGNGNGRMTVRGHEVPIVGSICMDMCFLDVTEVDCEEGDEVIVFGDAELLQRTAAAAGTIPYEILTSISPRVGRVYYQE